VIATILHAWLQQKLSVVAKPDCVYVVESYLVIWYMIASLGSVWLQNSRVVCDCKIFFVCVIANTASYFMTAK
jgi:isoprenylcysteine carboxyl methyltransferase (ICMT) family protein YpbQ